MGVIQSHRPPPLSETSTAWLIRVVSFFGLATLAFWRFRAAPVELDDAYISFHYAKSLLNGSGLVFNVEDGPLEGFTNLLWVLLNAAAMKLGSDPMAFSGGLGLTSLALSFALAIGRGDAVTIALRLVAAIFLMLMPSLIAIAGSGLETTFAGLLIVVMGVLVSRERVSPWLFAALASALVSTRPDGALFVAVGAFVVVCPRSMEEVRNWRPMLRKVLVFGAASAGPLLVLMTFRYGYFRELVPNTYYAKSADVSSWPSGFTYWWTFARSAPQAFVLLGLWLVGLLLRRQVSRRDLYGLLSVGLYVLYVAKVGGDFMSYRFAFQILPLVLFLWSGSLEQRWWLGVSLVGVPALAACLWFVSRPEIPENQYGMQTIEVMNSFVEPGRRVGLALKGALPKTARISTTLAGAVPYYAELFAVDEWGLNDRVISRQPSPPVGLGRRGHIKHSTGEYLDARGVNLEIGHPTLCDCTRRCDDDRAWVYLRTGVGNECVRMNYRTKTPELTRLFCYDRRFVVANIDCNPQPLPVFLFSPAADVAVETPLAAVEVSVPELLRHAHGASFGRAPATGALGGQSLVTGFTGALVNGFHLGDASTGWIDFPLPPRARRVELNLGGGRASDQLFVGIAGGETIYGRVGGENTEHLSGAMLSVPPGVENPRLIIFDGASNGWGHLMVSNVRVMVEQ